MHCPYSNDLSSCQSDICTFHQTKIPKIHRKDMNRKVKACEQKRKRKFQQRRSSSDGIAASPSSSPPRCGHRPGRLRPRCACFWMRRRRQERGNRWEEGAVRQTRALSSGDSQQHNQERDVLLQPASAPSVWLSPTHGDAPGAAPPGTPCGASPMVVAADGRDWRNPRSSLP
jgi:hypothetical protein